MSGAIYISFVCVLPTLLVKKFNVPFYFGGTALLIVVGVALDTIQQIESHLIFRHYDGLVKKSARRRGESSELLRISVRFNPDSGGTCGLRISRMIRFCHCGLEM